MKTIEQVRRLLSDRSNTFFIYIKLNKNINEIITVKNKKILDILSEYSSDERIDCIQWDEDIYLLGDSLL